MSDCCPPWLDASAHPDVGGLPPYGYRIRGDHCFKERCKPFNRPRVKQLPSLVGMSYRYVNTWMKFRRQGKKMCIDNLNLLPWKPIYGVPLGGIGCGTIGRGHSGEFCRFQMVPGMYAHKVVDADQFILTIRKGNETVHQCVLSPHKTKGKLTAWKWGFPAQNITYHGLYPRSWTRYDIPECNLIIICRQVSPVYPDEYQETCFPGAVFVWEIINNGPDALDVSITFTFKNGQGTKEDKQGGVWSKSFQEGITGTDDCVSGAEIHQTINEMPCVYGIAAKHGAGIQVTEKAFFNPLGKGQEIWSDLLSDGSLKSSNGRSATTRKGEELACAVCAKTSVSPNNHKSLSFSLTWDMPKIHFGAKANKFHRRYTRFFGHDGNATSRLASHALNHYVLWEERIQVWQESVLHCSQLPAWYKSALFNETYFLSDGGTVWLDPIHIETPLVQQAAAVQEYGKFAYLEGHEYRMYNTFDVHYYSSIALLKLFPKLELSIQYDMASSVGVKDGKIVKFCMAGNRDVTKSPDCVPHDVGDPDDEPWARLNAYTIHPTNEWKDLNPKFVLQVYRDFVHTQDEEFLSHVYPQCKAVMENSIRWDIDKDGLIDNSGFADQTYDAWTVTGASAYCGLLWLAALKMFCSMARRVGVIGDFTKFEELLEKGKKSYIDKLWNGEYFNYDSSSSGHHNSIMADQLSGQWYLKACDFPDNDVLPAEHVRKALESIFNHNVLPFDDGKMGAINGMKPNGKNDHTSIQSEEFWTGVTYSLAATMIQEGLVEKGLQTAYGTYHTCWERYGLAYQTPEAYYENRQFRSLGYMRPLSIWAIQQAIEKFHPHLLEN